jgi:hypothetical protein
MFSADLTGRKKTLWEKSHLGIWLICLWSHWSRVCMLACALFFRHFSIYDLWVRKEFYIARNPSHFFNLNLKLFVLTTRLLNCRGIQNNIKVIIYLRLIIYITSIIFNLAKFSERWLIKNLLLFALAYFIITVKYNNYYV